LRAPILFFALSLLLAAHANAQTNNFKSQIITLPFNANATIFVDVDNDGLSDLLALDQVGKKLLIYRQRDFGFTNAADQVLQLPPKTAWVTARDVDKHPGLELLFSTSAGIVYCRQTGGVFESEFRTLITTDQVFTNEGLPVLISQTRTDAIPVIRPNESVLYRADNNLNWQPETASALAASPAIWFTVPNEWMMGNSSSRSLHIQQSFQGKPKEIESKLPDSEALARVIEEARKSGWSELIGTNRVDLNGDGRKDLIFWQAFPGLDARTDLYVFLCGSDGKFPQRPTQVLHCRGFPIPINSMGQASPIADLKRDGQYQVVTLDLTSSLTSASRILDMVLSGGLEGMLTIRSFHQGAFSATPNAAVPVRTIMPITTPTITEIGREWPFFIDGDFNGDGRMDLVVRRTGQWTVQFSTDDGRWFTSQPALLFETPFEGYFDFKDLNGDGRSDIILRAQDDPRICIFMSNKKGAQP
jgi:hypothetical protein